MIIPDVNLLIYAHNRDTPDHRSAKEWLEDLMRSRKPVGIP